MGDRLGSSSLWEAGGKNHKSLEGTTQTLIKNLLLCLYLCTHNHMYVPRGGQQMCVCVCVCVCQCVHVLTIWLVLLCLALCFQWAEYHKALQTLTSLKDRSQRHLFETILVFSAIFSSRSSNGKKDLSKSTHYCSRITSVSIIRLYIILLDHCS